MLQQDYTQKTDLNASKIPIIQFIGFAPDVSHKEYERWINTISEKNQKPRRTEAPKSRWWELEEEESVYHHPYYYIFNKFHYEEIQLKDELPPDDTVTIYEDGEALHA